MGHACMATRTIRDVETRILALNVSERGGGDPVHRLLVCTKSQHCLVFYLIRAYILNVRNCEVIASERLQAE